MKYRGKEFSYKGKVYPKYYVYLWGNVSLISMDSFWDIKDKPGWRNGKLKDVKKYDEYLENVTFA